jgi:hypothetical protein
MGAGRHTSNERINMHLTAGALLFTVIVLFVAVVALVRGADMGDKE